MHRMSRRWIGGLCCLMVALMMPAGLLGADEPAPAAPAAPAKPLPPVDPTAVLKVIPADATAFLAVRNLQELDADIQGVIQKLRLPLEAIGFPGPLEFLKQNTGITEGLTDNGSLALVVLSCAKLQTVGELAGRAVVLIPCSDVDALVGAMGGEKEGELIKLPFLGQPSVAAAKGGFLVVGQTAEAVTEVVRAKDGGVITSLSPDRLEVYKALDVFAWASFRGIPAAIREEISNTVKGLMLFANPMAGGQAEGAGARITKFFEESKEISAGLVIDQKVGLKVVFCYRMKPDTEGARQLAAMKPAQGPLLAGLPDEPVIFAIGAGNSGNRLYEKTLREGMDWLLNPEVLGDQVDPAKLTSLKESLVKFVMSLEQVSFSVSGLPAESGDGLIGVAMAARVANSQQAQGQLRSLFSPAKEMFLKTAVGEEDLTEDEAATFGEAIQWKENAEKLAGAAVDQLIVDLSKLPDMDEERIARIKSVAGQEGVLIRIAAVGDKHVAVTFGGGTKRFAQIVDHIQKGQAPLAERHTIKMVADRLPAQGRLAEGYLSIDRLLALFMDISTQLDQPIPLPLAMKETAPIAFTLTRVDETAVQADVLVPIELGQSAMEMAEPFIQMMLMGAGGGMPGQPMPGMPMPGPDPDDGGLK